MDKSLDTECLQKVGVTMLKMALFSRVQFLKRDFDESHTPTFLESWKISVRSWKYSIISTLYGMRAKFYFLTRVLVIWMCIHLPSSVNYIHLRCIRFTLYKFHSPKKVPPNTSMCFKINVIPLFWTPRLPQKTHQTYILTKYNLEWRETED